MRRPNRQLHNICSDSVQLLQNNYRCRFGEIDLILKDRDTLVFTEVRLRAKSDFGGAAASIDARKQHKLILAAQHYLSAVSPTLPCRFDAVLLTSADGSQGVEWLKNAFQL